MPNPATVQIDPDTLRQRIHRWGRELGFAAIAITDTELGVHTQRLRDWLARSFHGEMDYMARHAELRETPDALHPNTLRVITARMDYRPDDDNPEAVLNDPELGYVSRYALGRDYHKLMRKRLAQLAERINAEIAPHHYRALVDSAPVLERAFAEKSGLGWIGKNTMLINERAGSWFFLGEIYTDLPLPTDPAQTTQHCGSCRACIDICPTGAIVAPFQVDARRCISYLTIELRGSIPEEFRRAIGNRIYGCDDCQLVCPWNKFSAPTAERDFQPRHGLAASRLVDLFSWDEASFLANTEGSAIRRIGYECWLRNLAVALGNAPWSREIIDALEQRREHPSALVREHVAWALAEQALKYGKPAQAVPLLTPNE